MRRLPVPIAIFILFAGDAALVLAYLLNELLGRPRDGLTRLLDLNGEANLPSWYSGMQGFFAAMLLWTWARRNIVRTDPGSRVLWLAPALLLLMSCDEVAQLHERFGGHTDAMLPGGSRLNTVFVHTGIWMFVVGIPFVIFLLWLLARTRRYFALVPRGMTLFAAGFAMVLMGSLVMDGVSNAFEMNSVKYNLIIAGEEFLEMTGMTVICWASLKLALASLPQTGHSAVEAATDGASLSPPQNHSRDVPVVHVTATSLPALSRSSGSRPDGQ